MQPINPPAPLTEDQKVSEPTCHLIPAERLEAEYTIPRSMLENSSAQLSTGSDVDIARCLEKELTQKSGKVVYSEGEFWRYTNTHWNIFPSNELRQIVHNYDGQYFITASGTRSCVKLGKNKIDSILHELSVILLDGRFFSNPGIGINCINGFVKFSKDGAPSLIAHSMDHRQRHLISGIYNNNQEDLAPQHNSLLAKLLYGVFQGDSDNQEKIDLLAEIGASIALGYATKLKQPKAIVLKGEKAENGKSQILDLFRSFMPSAAVSSIPVTRLQDERHIIGLTGKLLNACDELSAAAVASDIFKSVVTGEPISGRDVYKSRVEFRPIAQHVFATNSLPSFQDGMDRGVQRRLLVIPFNRVIPMEERIENIGSEIASQEMDLVLAWIIKGASRLIRQSGFSIPASSKAALRDWIYSTDPIPAWIDECCDHRQGNVLYIKEAYESFSAWAKNEGIVQNKIPAKNGFTQRLKVHAADIEQKRDSRGKYLTGIALKNPQNIMNFATHPKLDGVPRDDENPSATH